MSLQRKIKAAKHRRSMRVRSTFVEGKLRVSVFRSLQFIYAQLIDDQRHHTLVSFSSRELSGKEKLDKKQQAHAVGKELARRALDLGVKEAVFDRGSALYHGRVRSLAEGIREGGLQI